MDHFCGAGTAVPKLSVLRQPRQVTLAGPSCLRRKTAAAQLTSITVTRAEGVRIVPWTGLASDAGRSPGAGRGIEMSS